MQTANAPDTNKTTATGFASLQIITASCHGILNTQFTAPTPKPAWFDGLANELDKAKVLARRWINDIAPQMTASIPTHVVDYATTFSATTDEIFNLVDKNPSAKGKDNPIVQQVFALVQALEDELSSTITEVDGTSAQLKQWGDEMQAVHDALYQGAASIQGAMIDLKADIDKMNAFIKGLNEQIKADQVAVAVSAGAVGLGVFLIGVGIAVTLATAGTGSAVGGLIIGAGVVGVVGGAISWGVFQDKINKAYDEIAQDQKRLSDDQRQITALQGLSLSANTAISAIATALSALSDVKTMWEFFRGELQGTKNKLMSADEELALIINKVKISAAQREWDLAVQFAQQLIGVKVTVETKTLKLVA